MVENKYNCSVCNKEVTFPPDDDPPVNWICDSVGCIQAWSLKQMLERIKSMANTGLENYENYREIFNND